ncbi:mitochondrial carrier domain-containing protein [Hyaloraphidium curvatum]|nr:mitochondrial carrier domain-containing protein [Hyaloraphidium curvatum]
MAALRATVHGLMLSAADAAARTASAPLARAKIVLQVQHLAHPAPGLPYAGAMDVLRRQGTREGRGAAFRGNFAHVLRGPLSAYASSALFLRLSSWFAPSTGPMPQSRRLLAAFLAGSSSCAVEYPLGLARTLLAADLAPKGSPKHYSGIWDAVRQTARGHGFLSLYKGLGVGMLGAGIQTVVRLPAYDYLARNAGVDGIVLTERAAWARLGIAVLATVAGQLAAYPLDTVRRLAVLSSSPGFAGTYHGAWDAARQLLALYGWRAFYAGAGAGTARTAVAGAVQYVLFVGLMRFVGDFER